VVKPLEVINPQININFF